MLIQIFCSHLARMKVASFVSIPRSKEQKSAEFLGNLGSSLYPDPFLLLMIRDGHRTVLFFGTRRRRRWEAGEQFCKLINLNGQKRSFSD